MGYESAATLAMYGLGPIELLLIVGTLVGAAIVVWLFSRKG